MSTSYHARYFAYELTRRGGEGVERISRSLFDACVDLNPHQIEAALFALRSPISKGALLADEVGLGKTIEAGLILCQFWAEQRRRLMVICPASLRKQWSLELQEKFNLPTFILDAKSYRQAQAGGNQNPFESDAVVITSVNFASNKREEVRIPNWDLVVIDEAHKLRNAYKPNNVMGQNIRWALEDTRKILLTATPLQNSLLELYGLSSIIDENMFGDLISFRSQYTGATADLNSLGNRIRSFCVRTLRKQVIEYIKYTERRTITRPFSPTEQEHKLYEAISTFLQREDTYALPTQHRHLTILILRKLLASSSLAVAGTLEVMKDRLLKMRDGLPTTENITERIIEEEEMEDELLDEILSDEEPDDDSDSEKKTTGIDEKKLNEEIEELERYIQWARSIGVDTKSHALLKALKIGFSEMEKMGAKRKTIIFTESLRTQKYLKDFLESNGYADQVITFNGSNADPDSKAIYQRWADANIDSGRSSGSRVIDARTAIINYFKNNASIMLATEAAAEGINLQFCSLVINYDLPWNPQRIEQRIGRCHRYGQKFDVVVINFLNKRNEVDQRVFELLNEKFRLFSGVFGASDEVLGTIESGVDFEKRIFDIYQLCRTKDEIEDAFRKLQEEMEESIQSKMDETRSILLEHFDEDVHNRLKVNLEGTRQKLDSFSRMFWILTKFILESNADFIDPELSFELLSPPCENIRPGLYRLISKEKDNIPGEFLYRLSHPLGEYVIETGKNLETSLAHVEFDISNHPVKISLVEELKGQSGWLILQYMIIDSFEREEHLLFSGIDGHGKSLNQETCEKIFNCLGKVSHHEDIIPDIKKRLEKEAKRHAKATLSRSLEANNQHFCKERERLEKWAEDMVIAAEKELSDTKNRIKALNRQARQAPTIDEQHKIQERIRELEKKKRRQRQQIFDVEDEIMEKRDSLISSLEKRMAHKTSVEPLFTIKWSVV